MNKLVQVSIVGHLVGLLLLCTFCSPQAEPKPSVTTYKPDKFYRGYTLCSSRHTERARLIDMEGNEIHSWEFVQGGSWHYAEMLPNGHLIAIIKDQMILELDWNSNLVWKCEMRAHHDFDRLPNGNTMVISRERILNPELSPDTLLSDFIVEKTSDCGVVWRWNSDEHARELQNFVEITFPVDHTDWAHTNTVEVLRENVLASRDPRFQAGNVLTSFRNVNTIAVIDRKTKKIVWAWGPGVLDRQHMPTLLENGHILMYDNGSDRGYTRILELDVLRDEIVWEYTADPPESFFSNTRGSNQRLPNGNTLTGEADSGHLVEITPAGEVVWEYENPDTLADGRQDALYRVIRYTPEEIEPLL
ncbi:MAG TPA: aryl-sulfate sulfotransferase [bacterium]|nr:aryl-sulfate sulfotransferase [bacterium]